MAIWKWKNLHLFPCIGKALSAETCINYSFLQRTGTHENGYPETNRFHRISESCKIFFLVWLVFVSMFYLPYEIYKWQYHWSDCSLQLFPHCTVPWYTMKQIRWLKYKWRDTNFVSDQILELIFKPTSIYLIENREILFFIIAFCQCYPVETFLSGLGLLEIPQHIIMTCCIDILKATLIKFIT